MQDLIFYWPTLVEFCEGNKNKIGKNVNKLGSNFNLKRNLKSLFEQSNPVVYHWGRPEG